MDNVLKTLLDLRDLKYKEFHSKLVPNINPDTIIGVRAPKLREIAKKMRETEVFFNSLPHKYYDENVLHGFLISEIKDFEHCIEKLEKFLPFVDNWAVCDGIRPKCFKKNPDKLLPYINKWLKSKYTYTVRFSIEMLMIYYLDDEFKEIYVEKVSKVKSEDYYVNMMIAWYFATALCKKWDCAIKYLEENKLPLWIHNKTIQKATESLRITDEQKIYLKNLKIKGAYV